MRTDRFKAIPFLLIHLLSVLAPATCWIHSEPDLLPQETDPGYAWLSYPVGLVMERDPVIGWILLHEPEPEVDEPMAEVAHESAPLDPDRKVDTLDIELRGHVVDDGTVRYCFLDTNTSRWFRMVPGEADTLSGLSLVNALPDGTVRMIRLNDGELYMVPPGRRNPVRVEVDKGPSL